MTNFLKPKQIIITQSKTMDTRYSNKRGSTANHYIFSLFLLFSSFLPINLKFTV